MGRVRVMARVRVSVVVKCRICVIMRYVISDRVSWGYG